MVDDSLEFATSEYTFQDKKLNRKSSVIGNFTQLTDLSPTYPGQEIFTTTTGGAFTADTWYIRNAANNAWNVKVNLTETIETGVILGGNTTVETSVAGTRYYNFHTLPTTEKFYVITGIEVTNEAPTAGNVLYGVDIVNANPPTLASTPLVALTQEVVVAPVTQRISVLWSKPIRGGTILGVWSSFSGVVGHHYNVSATGYTKLTAYSATPKYSDNTAFTTVVNKNYYAKIYYRGYK